MSKHVWRGVVQGKTQPKSVIQGWDEYGCTVVEDAANFPVREAMRLCRNACGNDFDALRFNCDIVAFNNAVARMKARKGKRA